MFNPLPGDGQQPGLEWPGKPVHGHRADRLVWAPVPWKRELGRQCPRPGSKLPPVPSEPGLWAQPVSTFCKPCTQQAEPGQAARGTPRRDRRPGPAVSQGTAIFPPARTRHTAASLSRLLWGLSSPQPFLLPRDPPQLPGAASWPGNPLLPGPGGRASSSCCRERRVSPRRGHPGPTWSPVGSHGPRGLEPDEWPACLSGQEAREQVSNRCPTTPCQARTHRHRRGDHIVARPDLPQAQDGLQLPLDWLLQLFMQRLQRDTLPLPSSPPTTHSPTWLPWEPRATIHRPKPLRARPL
nr:uncharacterized protein LOC116152048 [Camelus dromedarius]